MKMLTDMWNDAVGFVMSLPFLGDAFAWAKAQEFAWLLVMTIAVVTLANHWLKSGSLAHWAYVGRQLLLVLFAGNFALGKIGGHLPFAPSWGAWGLAIVILVCHAEIHSWINWALAWATPAQKSKASAAAPAKAGH